MLYEIYLGMRIWFVYSFFFTDMQESTDYNVTVAI